MLHDPHLAFNVSVMRAALAHERKDSLLMGEQIGSIEALFAALLQKLVER